VTVTDPGLLSTENLLRAIQLTWTLLAFAAGAAIGSFLNVVAYRVPAGLSVVHPRSRCPGCGTPIAWYDNLPVLSFLILRGRCRSCRAPISPQYPLVELACGVLGVALWLLRGPSALLAVQATAVALLVALTLIDARHYLLPEVLTLPLLGVALIGRVVVALVDQGAGVREAAAAALDGLLGAALGASLLGGIGWVGTRLARRSGRIAADQDALGFGDVVLIAGIGALVGPWPVLSVLFLASVQGAVIGVLVLWLRRDETSAPADGVPTSEGPRDAAADGAAPADDEDWQPPAKAIPFGPFLALGAVEWLLLERTLAALYEGLVQALMP
jgi:leader peptidase (prepilin peptidase)/N-methyltransferase